MSLSLWQCDHPGCDKTCVGKGGGVGLRAIGWYFQTGFQLYCPLHRPDPNPCRQTNTDHLCSQCAAEHVVRQLQPKLMSDPEVKHYVGEILPILHRQDLEQAVRSGEGRTLYGMEQWPQGPPALCEHGVTEYGGCKNTDCPNCPDNIIPEGFEP